MKKVSSRSVDDLRPEYDFSSLKGGPALLRGPAFAGIAIDQREQSLGMTETCGPHTFAYDADAILPEHLRGSFGSPMEGMVRRTTTKRWCGT